MAEIKLTKMMRGEMFADVHPDEVAHMTAYNWVAVDPDEFHDDGTMKVTYTEDDAAEQAEVPKKKRK